MLREATIWATISGVLLGTFLLIRPLTAYFGAPQPLDRSDSIRLDLTTSHTPPDTTAAGRDSTDRADAPARLEAVESVIQRLVNEERQRRGLSPVRPEDQLSAIAFRHSEDMILRDFFSHINPDALAPSDRIFRQHRRLVGLGGENIWSGSYQPDPAELGQRIVDGWMESPVHRENILRSAYSHLGVGVARQDSIVTATQKFAAVRAYTNAEVRRVMPPGEEIQISTTPSPQQVDIWNPDRGLKAAGPYDPSSIQVPTSPGEYRLRFYFNRDGGFAIYSGPSIQVK